MEIIKHMKYLGCILLVLVTIAGCAYVNDSRVYEIRPDFEADQVELLSSEIEKHLIEKGLVLKSRYHDLYPENIYVSVFEIPRTEKEERRDPQLIVLIKNERTVQLKHSEWWYSKKSRPADFIKGISDDIKSLAYKKFDAEIDIRLIQEDLY